MTWVLWLWLASSPGVLIPLEQFSDSRECLAAMSADIRANVRAGVGGGATYFLSLIHISEPTRPCH
jgi:hypothetical protein